MKKPEVHVTPAGHLLMDDELCMQVQGLQKGQNVTIYATIEEDMKKFESYSWFVADDAGLVDLQKHESLGGTYSGVSSMGIFWSMIQAPGQMKGIRMMKKNVDTPLSALVTCYIGHMTMENIRASQVEPMISHVIDRWYKSPGVTYREVTDGQVRGKLFLPPGRGPFPGVIDMFGIVGGLTEYRSALLASRGFASFALPYFNYKDLPRKFEDVDLDYFLESVDWLLSHDEVYSEGLGVVGVSKGGSIALIMGAHCPKVRAIVNINGCTFCATTPIKYSGGDIPAVEFDRKALRKKDGAYIMKAACHYGVDDLTPVWNNNAKILNILGEDDQCSPVECIRLMEQHFPSEKADNFRIASYPGAGHLVEPPYTPHCAMSYTNRYDLTVLWGGTQEAHAFAQEDSWRRIQQFLHDHIPKTYSNIKVSKL